MCASNVVRHSFEKFWKPFVRVFQVFCTSHYAVYHTNAQIYRFIYFITLSSIHVFFMIYTLKTVHYLASHEYKEIPLMGYVSFMSITGDFLEHVIAHLEPLFARKHEEEMYKRFEEINEIFSTKLDHRIDFDAVRRKQKSTIGFFVFSGLFALGLSFFTMPTGGYNILAFLLTRVVTITIIRIRRCQASFVINLLSYILTDLQQILRRSQENYGRNSTDKDLSRSEDIRYLRDIYSNVWIIKNLISCCYGWSFITFIMDFCFDSINSSYWLYVTIKSYKSRIKIIRKVTFILKILLFLKL